MHILRLFKMMDKNPGYLTGGIVEAARDPVTRSYIFDCGARFYRGDFGTMPAEDVQANIAELKGRSGRAIGRYKANLELKHDIYIIGYFSDDDPSADSNYTTYCYVTDY